MYTSLIIPRSPAKLSSIPPGKQRLRIITSWQEHITSRFGFLPSMAIMRAAPCRISKMSRLWGLFQPRCFRLLREPILLGNRLRSRMPHLLTRELCIRLTAQSRARSMEVFIVGQFPLRSRRLSAVAFENGYTSSPVTSATYNIQAPPPIISPAGGTYTSALQVTITDFANSAPIYYTTDGTQPTTSSTQYEGPLNVSTSETVQAIASGNGYSSSNVVSASYTVNLPPADFSLTLSPSSLTVNSGGSATAKLTIAPINGFNQPVTFACSGLPATASCSFSPPTVTPAATATTSLTITATSNTATGNSTRVPFAPLTSLALMFGLFTFRKRRSSLFLVLIIAGTGLLFSLSACGSGGATAQQNTSPTNSTITVTATSGVLSHSQALTLTLN